LLLKGNKDHVKSNAQDCPPEFARIRSGTNGNGKDKKIDEKI
jgi:hypothetical protein